MYMGLKLLGLNITKSDPIKISHISIPQKEKIKEQGNDLGMIIGELYILPGKICDLEE